MNILPEGTINEDEEDEMVDGEQTVSQMLGLTAKGMEELYNRALSHVGNARVVDIPGLFAVWADANKMSTKEKIALGMIAQFIVHVSVK